MSITPEEAGVSTPRHPRSATDSDVAYLEKLGYKQEILGVWFAWMLPAGTPPEVAQALLPALQKAARDPGVAARLLPLGIVQEWEPANRLAAEITHEYDTITQVTSKLRK